MIKAAKSIIILDLVRNNFDVGVLKLNKIRAICDKGSLFSELLMRYFSRDIFVPLFLTLAADPKAVQKKVLLVMSGSERTIILKKQMKYFVCRTAIRGDKKKENYY